MTQIDQPGGADPIAEFAAELEQIRAKAEEVQELVRTASATVRSPDGAVTVTVGATGALTNIAFGPRAYQRPPEALSALVLQTMGAAQKQVATQVSGAFGGLVGENSAAMEVLEEFLPRDPGDGDDGTDSEAASFARP
ncbi:YbaB/EbfC family nucleoid-associated protein, partial [Amycolatopsis rhizosphaerae]|uniref:YbaB/EbfC family nucleoid-associated protein n=1 Tax=Amycolatopsis rhizosphaerae TaxID=2053003 RepID=UPI001FE7478C